MQWIKLTGGGVSQLRKIVNRAIKRSELGIPVNAKVILSVGELSVRKNHKVVIKALNELKRPDVYYIIVGKGILKEELEKIDTTGRLRLLGYRTDIAEILQASDLFIFPFLYTFHCKVCFIS